MGHIQADNYGLLWSCIQIALMEQTGASLSSSRSGWILLLSAFVPRRTQLQPSHESLITSSSGRLSGLFVFRFAALKKNYTGFLYFKNHSEKGGELALWLTQGSPNQYLGTKWKKMLLPGFNPWMRLCVYPKQVKQSSTLDLLLKSCLATQYIHNTADLSCSATSHQFNKLFWMLNNMYEH